MPTGGVRWSQAGVWGVTCLAFVCPLHNMYDIDLCCEAVFTGAVGRSRLEEEETDFAEMEFINL